MRCRRATMPSAIAHIRYAKTILGTVGRASRHLGPARVTRYLRRKWPNTRRCRRHRRVRAVTEAGPPMGPSQLALRVAVERLTMLARNNSRPRRCRDLDGAVGRVRWTGEGYRSA